MAGHLWEDAQHSKELRTRLWELRHPDPDRDADGSLAALSSAVRSGVITKNEALSLFDEWAEASREAEAHYV